MEGISAYREKINKIDAELARLFESRMDAVSAIAEIKRAEDLPVYDPEREQNVIEKTTALIRNKSYKPYFEEFIKSVMDISKKYQSDNFE